jgi:hypothetical protein
VRRGDYFKTFGADHVRFHPIAAVEQATVIESMVASHLFPYRMRGQTGRLNEWLSGVSPFEVESVILAALKESGLNYTVLGNVHQ